MLGVFTHRSPKIVLNINGTFSVVNDESLKIDGEI
jgi:hypothetical protein